MEYTDLLVEADQLYLITKDKPLRAHDGRIKGNRIAIRKDMPEIKKKCVLAEELGHYYTTVGDIMDQGTIANQKQEYRARLWSYNKLIGLNGIVTAYKSGCRTIHATAEYLGVTEEFLLEALQAYKQKYGVYAKLDNYVIYFEPTIGVFEFCG
jgi:hypothetical protein